MKGDAHSATRCGTRDDAGGEEIFRADVGDKARRLVASTRPLPGESAHSQTATVASRSMRFASIPLIA